MSHGSARVSRKAEIRALYERLAAARDNWIQRHGYYYSEDYRVLSFLIPPGLRVLEVGCGTGSLLAALRPARGVGVDFSTAMIERAKANHPHLEFVFGDAEDAQTLARLEGPFDVVVLADTFSLLDDCQTFLAQLKRILLASSRVVIVQHNHLWELALRLGESLGLKMPQVSNSWLSQHDVHNLFELAGYEVVQTDQRQLVPYRLGGVGSLVNRYVATLPLLQKLCLRSYIVSRPLVPCSRPRSASVIVPCRNEKGNIAPLVERLPVFAEAVEIIFVEGHSHDGTYQEVERVMTAFPDKPVKLLRQPGIGKADAVRAGMAVASGEIVMILDADMTVAPEDMQKVFEVLASNQAEFVNGTRFVYPMEGGAMRFLNLLGNRAFSLIFSWLLNRRFTDTLCGTKALRKVHWDAIARTRQQIRREDPFGDFDLILGAARLTLKTVEIPLRYGERLYGETQISRFRHGWYLLQMAATAYRHLKAF